MGVYTRIYPKLVFQTIYGNADGKTQPTDHQQHRRSKTQTTKQRSQTQANTPKLPTTWKIYRPLKQTCHAGIQYAHPNSRAVYPPGLTYLLLSYLILNIPASAACLNTCHNQPAHLGPLTYH